MKPANTSSQRKNKDAEPQDEQAEDESDDQDAEQEDESAEEDEVMQDAPSDAEVETSEEAPSRKRKRAAAEDVEETYMRRLAKEEQKVTDKRHAEKAKQQKVRKEQDSEDEASASEPEEDEDDSTSDEEGPVPVHESLTGGGSEAQEIEKSNRTVFLGNVSSKAITSHSAKNTLVKHLESFVSTLPESKEPHKVQSIRFRSTAFASGGRIPKRASFARREVMDETTPSTNAYAIYSTIPAARKAPAALNGTMVLDRHLRVDNIAHPSPTDHKRCVFVGNLDFVGKTTDPEEEEKKKKKNREPADVEEGLWRTFDAHTGKSKSDKNKTSRCSNVESVRVVRDQATRVSKGFAYVQFYDENCVEEAIHLDGKAFPPLLPRKLRVSRAKKAIKKREAPSNEKIGDARKTLQGRAGKLLGKAGQAQLKARDRGSVAQNSMVFEGHRATEGSQIKVKTKSRGSKAKKNNRSSQRAAAYRSAGGKKEKTKK